MMNISREELKSNLITKLQTNLGKSLEEATVYDIYLAVSFLARDYVTKNWVETNGYYRKNDVKQVYYFSLEFLMGKMLSKNLDRLGIEADMQDILKELGFDYNEVADYEPESGLGNGGLGRLAACFMDSLSACGFAGHGNGIRYTHGLFKQKIQNGYQIEESDDWLETENVWEIEKRSDIVEVKLYGYIRDEYKNGKLYFIHENYEPVMAIPYDVPIMGFQNKTVNTLRLWSAEPKDGDFDFESFRRGDYVNAVNYRQSIRAISDALYPDDSNFENKLLRLKQQYFFVCAGLTSILKRYMKNGKSISELPNFVAIHINDTHPALAVAELMRLLMDEYKLEWKEAFDITVKTISYTNHTIMPEALETWASDIYQKLLPRIYQITTELNARFCHDILEKYPNDYGKLSSMAIEADGRIRMANLAIFGSHSINGVAAVHSEILKKQLFKDFYELYPERFSNKTNGITHRRWLCSSNKRLTNLLTEAIGDDFHKSPLTLHKIMDKGLYNDASFLESLDTVKQENKLKFSNYVFKNFGVTIDHNSIFDFQVKRIHAYKRQLMNVLKVIDLYLTIKDTPNIDLAPSTFFFAGKAAPGYTYAKLIIKLINSVASLVNNDEQVNKLMKVLFLENYNVSMAQRIYPAADISEQISTASKEASGTSNMKFMMNGALTLGTMDGANIEIAEAVGMDNIFTFGLSVEEVLNLYKAGTYRSREIYDTDLRIKRILDALINGTVKDSYAGEFTPIFNSLVEQNDEYFVLKDFESYVSANQKANALYKNDKAKWLTMSAINIGNSGRFSSDETIKQYAKEIWNIKELNF